MIGSYGLDQCLDLVENALASGRGEQKPDGDDWLEGKGVAAHAQDAAPPTEHRSEAHLSLLADGTYHLAVGSAEFGNGITNAQRQVAATVLATRATNISMDFADTDRTPYDTGTFGSTGTSVAAVAVSKAAEALRDNLVEVASALMDVSAAECRLEHDRVQCGNRSISLKEVSARSPFRDKLQVSRKAYELSTNYCVPGAWLSYRGPSYYGRNSYPSKRSRLRCRYDHQSHAGPGTSGGCNRAGNRDHAL